MLVAVFMPMKVMSLSEMCSKLEKKTRIVQFLQVLKGRGPLRVCVQPVPQHSLTCPRSTSQRSLFVTAWLWAILMCLPAPLVGAQEAPFQACEKKGGWEELSGKVPLHVMVDDHRQWLKNPIDYPPEDFSGKNLQEEFLDGLDLRKARFVQADLRYADLQGSTLDHAILHEACLELAELQGTSLMYTDLTRVDFTEAELSGANLIHANLKEANLSKANLGPQEKEPNTESSQLKISEDHSDWYKNKSSCGLKYQEITSSMDTTTDQFSRTDLRCADLSAAILKGTNLSQADLRGANLSGANLSPAALFGANLPGADLRPAILTGADLRDTNLTGANLSWANLTGADLRGADLTRTDLSRAILTGANLRGADLKKAVLKETVLKDAQVASADFAGANLHNADMTGVDLTFVSFDLMPEGIPNVLKLHAMNNHLEKLSFTYTPLSLKELERKFNEAGMMNEEQAVIAAIEHTRTKKLLENPWTLEWLTGVLRLVFFQITSDYGWARGTLFKSILLIWLASAILYACFIAFNRKGKWGLRATWSEGPSSLTVADEKDLAANRSPQHMVPASPDCFWPYFNSKGKGRPLKPNIVSDMFASVVGGMYTSTLFSFIAIQIFPFGLSSLDLSKWIATTLNPRECEIHAAGWIKLAAAVQSTMTLYLLGLLLWLTWGHPFG